MYAHVNKKKSHIDYNTVVVEDFNTSLTLTDRPPKQKLNKEILELSNTIDQMNLTDVYRIFHLTTEQYMFFSAAHRTFSKIDHILGEKQALANIRK
jgi:exonuclease III